MRKLLPSALVVLAFALATSPAWAESWRVHVGGGGGYHAGPAAPHVAVGVHVAPHVNVAPVPRGFVGPQGRVVVHDYRFHGPNGGVWVPPVRVWRPSWYYRYWWPYRRSYYWYDYGYYGGYPATTCCAVERTAYPGPAGPPDEPRIGLGLRASGMNFGKDQPRAEGIGALLRIRASSVELELEVGRDRYPDLQRDDTRVGTSLIIPLFGRVLQPYVVGGVGVNFVELDGGFTHRTQGFLAGGGGLALNIGRGFTLSADVRYVIRHFFDDSSPVSQPVVYNAVAPPPPPTGSGDSNREAGVEGRVSAIFYF
jgi:hypothetical protein